jgi:hypothetical protein
MRSAEAWEACTQRIERQSNFAKKYGDEANSYARWRQNGAR